MTITLCIALPYIFNIKITSLGLLMKLLLCSFLVLYFWGEALQYTLSDAPAMYFMLWSLALLKYILLENADTDKWKMYLAGFAAGISLYAAYNTRVAHLYGIVIAGVLLIFWNRKRLKDIFQFLPFILAGCILLAMPQILINYHYIENFTPRVLTEAFSGYQKTLQATQVY